MHAILLAAGLGRRVGGCKARLLVGGTPLLVLHARAARAFADVRVCVVRPDDVGLVPPYALAVTSSEPDQAGSLALGVAALPDDDAPVLVTPVDALPPEVATVRALVAALVPGVLAVTPTYHGQGGHPVLVRRGVLAPYLRGARPPLSELLAALGLGRVRLPVEDGRVVTDLDDAPSVLEATGALPRFA